MQSNRPMVPTTPEGVPPTLQNISGRQFPSSRFVVHHTEGEIDPGVLHSLLAGNAVGMHIHGYIQPKVGLALADAFRDGVRRARVDDVPAAEMGTGHYGKSLEGYLDAAQASRAEMTGLWKAAGIDLAAKLQTDLQAALDPGQVLRTAQHRGRSALELRAVAWRGGSGGLKLLAHEDVSQLSQKEQRRFEVQTVRYPVATNVYADNKPGQGGLRIWNLQPSEGMRKTLGLQHSGYPYPADLLAGIDYVDLQPEPGDCIIAFGSLLHGVLDFEGALSRVVYNGFIGLTPDSSQVLRWT